jgi:hypothetical protein
MGKGAIVILSFLIALMCFILFASANNTFEVEADIVASDEYLEIEVDPYIYFGQISKGEKSGEITVHVNNTGTVDIGIVPELPTGYSGIFEYLTVREQKSDVNGVKNISRDIGEFSMNISKPASGQSVREEQFYITLDLTDYTDPIYANSNEKVNITILAFPN